MKLITGKTSDYYDCMLSYNSTEGNTYFRDNSEIAIKYTRDYTTSKGYQYSPADKNNPYNTLVKGLNYRGVNVRTKEYGEIHIRLFRVLFCGILYNGLHFSQVMSSALKLKYSDEYLYTIHDIKTTCYKLGIELPESLASSKYWQNDSLLSISSLKKYLIPVNVSDIAINNKMVVAILYQKYDAYEYTVYINCELKRVQFYKVFDSYSAYQELSMYVDGVLAYPGNIAIEIDDKYKIEGKGFDAKYGFRTRPKGY
jgi:hypothetical protein